MWIVKAVLLGLVIFIVGGISNTGILVGIACIGLRTKQAVLLEGIGARCGARANMAECITARGPSDSVRFWFLPRKR